MTTLRIATRGSKLALWQANHIADCLVARDPALSVELVLCKTTGDQVLDRTLAAVGGKGLFTKEVEGALLDWRADVAVHSLKDVPAEITDGLVLAAFPKREIPWDALLLHPSLREDPDLADQTSLSKLPRGARVGTSSLRRTCQLLAHRQDLRILPLRGNVDTRIRKLLDGEMEAAVLAAAGLARLGLSEHVAHLFGPQELLPACGQGALAVQCRTHDEPMIARLAALDDFPTRQAVLAERALNARLFGSCHTPIGAFAEVLSTQNDVPLLTLTAFVGSPDGKTVLRASLAGPASDPERLAEQVAAGLLDQGAARILPTRR